ncbi:Uncharacterized conserved protein [Rhizobiales bacterium GAS188]|nr:Uncharacterized conserved protein [Rhizobiales bacterium GAS188]
MTRIFSHCRSGTNAGRRVKKASVAVLFALSSVTLGAGPSHADEGGVSFWLPGEFGSLAAVPGAPGWAFSSIYIHPSVKASGGTTFIRGGQFVAGVTGRGDLLAYGPTYIFATPVLGGQASVSLLNVGGRNWASISATLTGPMGNTIEGTKSQSLTSLGDLLPQASLKWNYGVHNFMVYGTGDIPVGDYDSSRLANLGLGHGAIDGGGGYTYFNPASGLEFSSVLGFTYNFENQHTKYQNGVDAHLDWGASYFLTKQFHFGAVGYYYQQLTGDSGTGAKLGPFKSRVAGIGPQLGYIFPVGDKVQGYFNVKAYKEFAAKNRPDGWNFWVTVSFSAAPPHPSEPEAVSLVR